MKLIKRRPSPAMIVALLALFVALGGVGVAANGGNLILGQSNSATAATSLSAPVAGGKALAISNTSTTGGSTALNLNVAPGHPPLTVSSGAGKVGNLNADKLDGLDSAAFVPASAVQRLGPITIDSSTDPFTQHPVATIGPFTLKVYCYDNFSDLRDVDLDIVSSVDHSSFASTYVRHDGTIASESKPDMSAGVSQFLGTDGASGANYSTKLFMPVTGAAIDPAGHQFLFNLYAGQDVGGQTGKCVFGGSVIVK